MPDAQTGFFAAVFEDTALSYSCKKSKGTWDFLWTFDHRPDEEQVEKALQRIADELSLPADIFGNPAIEPLEDKDWLLESYRALPPFTVGPFFIYGSHFDGPLPDTHIPLMIEAATAFGSGEHGTTSRCLMAIAHVKDSGFHPNIILDMGCGSGILAAAAAKLWPDLSIHAADNDPECVIVSQRHMDANNIRNVECYQSEGYEPSSPVWKSAPYDFIIANILAGPLIDMAAEQSRAVSKNGYLILSGTLKEQADDVLAAYTPHGFTKVFEFPGDEWMTLLLQKTA